MKTGRDPEIIFIKETVPLHYMGGGERWLIAVSKALTKMGVDVIIAEMVEEEKVQEVDNIKIINFGHDLIKSPKRLFSDIEAELYYYMPVYAHFVVATLRKRPKESFFIVGHHNPWLLESNNIYDKIARKYLRKADLNHCLNATHANILKKYLPEEKIKILPNTFSLLNPELKIAPNKNDDTFEILFVGRFIENKGVRDLPKIFVLLEDIKDLKLNIVGRGSLEAFIKKWTKNRSNVDFLGFLKDSELIKVYRRAHLVIMPSKYEASPLVLNEALSFGCAVVAYDIAPVVESAKLRKNPPKSSAKFVPQGSVNDMAKAIRCYYKIWKEGNWKKIEDDALNSVETLQEYVNKFSTEILKLSF